MPGQAQGDRRRGETCSQQRGKLRIQSTAQGSDNDHLAVDRRIIPFPSTSLPFSPHRPLSLSLLAPSALPNGRRSQALERPFHRLCVHLAPSPCPLSPRSLAPSCLVRSPPLALLCLPLSLSPSLSSRPTPLSSVLSSALHLLFSPRAPIPAADSICRRALRRWPLSRAVDGARAVGRDRGPDRAPRASNPCAFKPPPPHTHTRVASAAFAPLLFSSCAAFVSSFLFSGPTVRTYQRRSAPESRTQPRSALHPPPNETL